MPASTKKNIYLAKNVAELNKMAENIPKGAPQLYVKSADRLFKAAEASHAEGDEERAYVLYMKFFNIFTLVKKSADYKKNASYYSAMFGTKKCVLAIDEAEKLAASLKERYEEMEAQNILHKLDERDRLKEKEEKNKEEERIAEEKKTADEEMKNGQDVEVEPPSDFITVHDLYRLLMKGEGRILIMDVRSEANFAESRLIHRACSCISVPDDIVPPGITVKYIEDGLPSASRSLWGERANVDHIILVDWDGNEASLHPQATARSLKDAMCKWDRNVVLKSSPLVLAGGYREWVFCYPTLTTNSKVTQPKTHAAPSPIATLDSIDYDLDLGFLSTPEPPVSNGTSGITGMNGTGDVPSRTGPAFPVIDRSTKPRGNSGPQVKPAAAASHKLTAVVTPSLKPATSATPAVKPAAVVYPPGNSAATVTSDSRIASGEDARAHANGGVKPPVDKSSPTDLQPVFQDVISSDVGTTRRRSSTDVPTVNRALKPSLSKQETRNLNEPELEDYKQETARLIAEHRARKARLEDDERQLERLDSRKRQELKETADILRTKRALQQDLEDLEERLWQIQQEQKNRQERKSESPERSDQSKLSKEESLSTGDATCRGSQDSNLSAASGVSAASTPQPSPKKAENTAKQETRPSSQKPDDADKKAKGSQERDKYATERREVEAKEKARLENEAREKAEGEAKEKAEREAKERAQREAKEREARAAKEREARDRAAKEREQQERERERQMKEKSKQMEARNNQPQSGLPTTPGLPPGWQRRMDSTTGRYYYVDHNTRSTHFQPPDVAPSPTVSTPAVYKTKLKEEPTTPSTGGGLKRSHSSPNIAKMMQEEEEQIVRPLPMVDRTIKPKPAPQTQPVVKQEVSMAKVRNLQPTWGTVGRGLTGLRNLGNTCYMNSTLQCLSKTAILATYFLNDIYSLDINRNNFLGSGGVIAEEFWVIMKALWSGQYRSITPRDFKSCIAKHNPMFSGYDQQDSQELLLTLMDGLHEDLNKVESRPRIPEQQNDGISDVVAAKRAWDMHKRLNDSIMVDLFQGQFKSTVRCVRCDTTSVTFDAFMYLSLPIPSGSRCSLRDCLRHFSREEKMTGESQWLCTRCKCKQNAIKTMSIWKLPPILIIHLKRFYYKGMWREKINAHVDFPEDGLDLSKDVEGPQKREMYSLYAVSNHYGTIDGGHYTAYCKNPNMHKWFKYDDHEVYEMSKSDVKSSAAYILFYTSVHKDIQFK